MSHLDLLAQVGDSAQTTPWWVPLFTGIAGFVGTVVGGFITFLTTRHTNSNAEVAARERERVMQITDISIRFIQAIARQSVDSMKIKSVAESYQSVIETAVRSGDPAEAIAALSNPQGFDPAKFQETMKDTASQLNAMRGLVMNVGAAQSDLSEVNVLLAEMRLLLPNEIVRLAEMVSVVNFLAQVGSALPGMSFKAGGSVTAALNVFVNAVRHEIGLDYFVSEKVEMKDVFKVLQDHAARQRNTTW